MDYLRYVARCLAISKIGLKYSKDPYALENYEELELISKEMMNSLNANEEFVNYDRDFYPTPSSSVRVIVFNDDHELLMVKEKQDGGMAVPGGWCEVFDTLSETAIKEVKQETGLEIEIIRLVAIFQRERYKNYSTALSEQVHYFHGRVVAGKLEPNHEIIETGFYPLHQKFNLSLKNTIKELTIAIDVIEKNSEVFID
ncbi:MAG: NUDIX hydrolase N-terminal domain-containing protein [Erysipelotrichaceae bacterium]